jgi:hypothetical protein
MGRVRGPTQPIAPYQPIRHSAELNIREENPLSTHLASELRERQSPGQAGNSSLPARPGLILGRAGWREVCYQVKGASRPAGGDQWIACEPVI